MNDDLGLCDHCHQPIGERGWMRPAGYTQRLDDDGPDLPVYNFYCSQECSDDAD